MAEPIIIGGQIKAADVLALITAQKTQVNQVRWVLPGWTFNAVGNSSGLINTRIIYIPIFVPKETTYIRIGCLITNLRVGGTLDLRLFKWNNGLPGDLISSYGTVSTTLAVAVEIVIAKTLARGYYFLAYRADAAAAGGNIATPDPLSAITCPVASVSITNGVVGLVCPYVDGAYADPATAPTGYLSMAEAGIFLREN